MANAYTQSRGSLLAAACCLPDEDEDSIGAVQLSWTSQSSLLCLLPPSWSTGWPYPSFCETHKCPVRCPARLLLAEGMALPYSTGQATGDAGQAMGSQERLPQQSSSVGRTSNHPFARALVRADSPEVPGRILRKQHSFSTVPKRHLSWVPTRCGNKGKALAGLLLRDLGQP